MARQADVSHTLVSVQHPEIAALVKVTKDELNKPIVKKELKDNLAEGEIVSLRQELSEAKESLQRYARANFSLDNTIQELRRENELLRKNQKPLPEMRSIHSTL